METIGSDEITVAIVKDGEKGDTGEQGVPGPPGDDGSSLFTWVKYADTPTTGMSDDPTGKTYIGLAYNKPTATESTAYGDYAWSKNKGDQGIPGDDGSSLFTWLKYADTPTTGMSDDPTGKTYIGLAYNKPTATESTAYGDYTWSLIKGDPGEKGIPGEDGSDGAPGADGVGLTGTTISYAKSASGTTTPTTGWQATVPASTPGQYLWTRTVWSYSDGTSETGYSVAMWGATGTKGNDGLGIKTVIPQYYLSTSNSEQAGGSWAATPAAWVSGRYYWTRSQITWDDDTVTYSSAVLDQATNTANQNASNANASAQAAYRIVSNTGSIESTPAGAINPGTLNVAAYHPVNGTQTAYAGRWKIEASADQSTWTALYTSSANEASRAQTLTGSLVGKKFVRVSLYAAGGTTTILQQATLAIVEATGNFLVKNSNGLYVCDTEGDPGTGSALRLASDVVEMLKNGNVLMRIAATAIELGVNAKTSVIRLCGGTGEIGVVGGMLVFFADAIGLRGTTNTAISCEKQVQLAASKTISGHARTAGADFDVNDSDGNVAAMIYAADTSGGVTRGASIQSVANGTESYNAIEGNVKDVNNAGLNFISAKKIVHAIDGTDSVDILSKEATGTRHYSSASVHEFWGEMNIRGIKDTGWVWLRGPQNSDGELYGVKYRVNMGVCYVVVDLVADNGVTVPTTGVIIGTIPVGARPQSNVIAASTGKSNNLGQITIYPTGVMKCWLFNYGSAYFAASTSYPI